MVKVLPKIATFILFFALMSSVVFGVNLGSVKKNGYSEISKDESTKLSLLFWNIENEPYTIKLSVGGAPDNWIVIIDPNEFILNKSIGEKYINLPYTDEIVKAKNVNIFVKADKNSNPGNYSIIIKAETELNQGKGTLNVVPERLFEFEVFLSGHEVANVESQKNIISPSFSLNFDEVVSKDENQEKKDVFYIFVMLIILISLILLYKKF